MSADRFVVVGSTRIVSTSGTGTSTFPLTTLCLSGATAYGLGTVSAFRFASGALVLDDSRAIGAPGEEVTIARDVLVHRETNLLDNASFDHSVFVVGSTTDGAILNASPAVPFAGPLTTLQGGSDGFVLVYAADVTTAAATALAELLGTYVGGEGDDGLTGVNGWNEYVDHFAVCGWTNSGLDLTVASYFVLFEPATSSNPAIVLLREMSADVVAGSGDDHPTALGEDHATVAATGLLFDLVRTGANPPFVGLAAGGGVAVDERGRVNVVGTTNSSDYPFTQSPHPLTGRSKIAGANYDATRTVFDMLPAGMARTDLTGDIGQHVGTSAWNATPPAPARGGTTPFCALGQFGKRIGQPDPLLPRMLIDWEGPAPAGGVNGVIVIDRPPVGSSVSGAFVVIGFPFTAPFADPNIPGVEMWLDSTTAALFIQGNSSRSTRYPLATLPNVAVTFTVQVVSVLGSTVTCPAPGSTTHDFIASPALFFSY